MNQVTDKNFGLLAAYVIPGFFTLVGLSPHFETLQSWLGSAPSDVPTVGGFLYITLASVAAGLTVSTIRWLVLDHLHHWTGLPPPQWTFKQLQANIAAFETAVEYHYRYYQFYGHGLIAGLIILACHWPPWSVLPGPSAVSTTVIVLLALLFLVASRDALRKYYERASTLLIDSQATD